MHHLTRMQSVVSIKHPTWEEEVLDMELAEATAEAVASVVNNTETTSNETITKDTKHNYADISSNKELVLLALIALLLMANKNSEI